MKVAIIAGHSSSTAGKSTPKMLNSIDIDGDGDFDILKGTQYREHYADVGVSVELRAALIRCGFDTVKVGWDDEDASNDTLSDDSAGLARRQALVKAAKCDISVSVHFNAYGNGTAFNSASGVCTYIHSNPARVGDSATLAALVQARLVEGTKQFDRGVHSDAFAEVNCAAMGTKASVLVELAFMTNQNEAETMMAKLAFWTEAAEEICHGICEYTGVVYVEEVGNLTDAWKTEIAEKALASGIITDKAWLDKLDEPAPVWMVLAIANKLKEVKYYATEQI